MKKILILIAIFLAPMSTAFAHTGLVSSNLQSGSSLQELPQDISLIFNEDLMKISGKEINSLTLVAPEGSELQIQGITVVGAQLSAPMPTVDFMAGTYTLKYRVISADGHPVEDSFQFTYLDPNPARTVISVPADASEPNKVLFLAIGVGALLTILLVVIRLIKKKR